MPDIQRTVTVAERFVRRLFDVEHSREADLGVLALERGLIRGGHEFRIHVRDDGGADREPDIVRGDHPWDRKSGVHIVRLGIGAKCLHVMDWIVSSCLERAAWLDRVDGHGRPLKLLKLGSLERAAAEADKDMLRKASRTVSDLEEDDEVPHVDLADGWSLVRLLTPAALDLESKRMQHCIGHGAYDAGLREHDRLFLSLRDPGGRPHATLELVETSDALHGLVQLQGKQNQPPILRHLKRMRTWLKENVRPEDLLGEQAWWSRMARGTGSTIVDFDDPPMEAALNGRLQLRMSEGDVLPSLRLSVRQNLRLTIDAGRTSPVVLPDTLTSNGTVTLEGPGTFVFGDAFDASILRATNCRLENLPQRFRLVDAYLEGCEVDVLPATMEVGSLFLPGTSATFEEGFRATRIALSGSLVEELPADLSVDDLQVADCPLVEIPDGCRIVDLNVSGKGLRRIGEIRGSRSICLVDVSPDLRMADGQRTTCDMLVRGPGHPAVLPEGLHVGGTLSFELVSGATLPDGLRVGSLVLADDCVEALPDGMVVERSLRVFGRGGLDFGTDCEIGHMLFAQTSASGSAEETLVPRRVEFDSDISRIEADGTVVRRDPQPSF